MNRLAIPIALVATLAACGTDAVRDNQAPELRLDVPSTYSFVIGEESRITITATAVDPDGHPVDIGMTNKPDRAALDVRDGWAVMTWDPIASDVTPTNEPLDLIFYADDGLGGRTERVVSLSILAGNGVPRFENSPSVLYNTAANKPLIFEVRVRDDDTPRVAMSMPTETAPAGASYLPTGDKTGRFEWMPTEDQLEFRVHTVTFTANDGQNPEVRQKVSILLQKGDTTEERPDGPGTDPQNPTSCSYEDQVRHTPLGAQRGTTDYEVTATLSPEAAAKFDRLVVNWTDGDAYNNNELEFQGMEMANESGTFVGKIPNPLLPDGQSREYYYEICAIDDDSTDDDAVLCGPSSIYHSFIAYAPNSTGCLDDAVANQSAESAALLNGIFGWELHRACGGASDYYRMELQAGQDADLYVTYPFGAGVTVEMLDENQQLLPFEASSCSGFGYVYVMNQTDQPMTRYFRVTGADVPYQISPLFYEPVTSCVDTDVEPNESPAAATTLTPDGTTFAEQEICGVNDVDVFKFPVTAGQEINALVSFTHANGDLDVSLFAPSMAALVGADEQGVVDALSTTDNETIQHVAQETGDYYLVVYGYNETNRYTLSVDVSSSCTDDDSFGDNHTEATAAEVPAFATHRGLEVCGGSEDWFSFVGFQNEYIDIDTKITSGSASAVTVNVVSGGNVIATGTANGDTITTSFDVVTEGTHYLQISASAPVEYEFVIMPNTI